MAFSYTLFVSVGLLATTLVAAVSSSHFGFGVDRLKDSSRRSFHRKQQLTSSSRSLYQDQNNTHCCISGEVDYCEAIDSLLFKGTIDNFASAEDQTKWEGAQRYWINSNLWGGPGYPVFVFIGGEWEESCDTLMEGGLFLWDLAQYHNALLLNIEHRFYGRSFPFNDTTTDHLQFLTSDQALADLARLIDKVLEDYETPTSKVITVGGSYSGNLAAWFRLKVCCSILQRR